MDLFLDSLSVECIFECNIVESFLKTSTVVKFNVVHKWISERINNNTGCCYTDNSHFEIYFTIHGPHLLSLSSWWRSQ